LAPYLSKLREIFVMEIKSIKEKANSGVKASRKQANPVLSKEVKKSEDTFLYGIIVPCFNEETRFPYKVFLKFAQENPQVLLCFVNDGSEDKTLAVLKGLQFNCSQNISVFSCKNNVGKAEAVRQGILYIYNNFKIPSMGFLDSDCSTTPEEWLLMAKFKEKYPQFGAIVGSRIQRLGVNVAGKDKSIFNSLVQKFIRVILKTPFQDTQCGAKIFMRSLVPFLFSQPFMTPLLFDVEIFLRLQKKFGKTTLQKGVLEYPLMNWTETGDSRLKWKDSIQIPIQLFKLYFSYS
jgi:glycosyltransferase involved in cell wall biosynthesis